MQTNPQKIDLVQLKQAISIIDLAKELGMEVKNKQARCWNSTQHKHDDKHFSLGFDMRTNRFKCFACGVSGSIIDLYKEVKGMEIGQAIRDLAEKAGLSQINNINNNKMITQKTIITPGVNQPVNYVIYKALYDGLDEESLKYLTGNTRGLTKETIKRFCLFSINDYKKKNELLKKDFGTNELKIAGITNDNGNLIFYKHKIIIPFLENNRIVYLQGRRLDNENPRYLHIKRPTPLFNMDTLKSLKNGDKLYICEGVFDAMMLEQNGFHAIAILGVTNFKPEMADLLKNFEVILAFDNDDPGRKATEEVAKIFLFKGKKVKAWNLPEGIKDITEYFIKYNK